MCGLGLFVDELVAVARKELAWETDYIREAKCQNMFRCVCVSSECDYRISNPANVCV